MRRRPTAQSHVPPDPCVPARCTQESDTMNDHDCSPNPIGSTMSAIAPLYSAYADDADMADLIKLFVQEMPDRVDALHQAIAEQDIETIIRLSHQLKGAAGGYGFDVITEVAREVERQARKVEDVAAVKRRVDDLILLCHRASAGSPDEDAPTAA
jgi:HPt (histidine-containing phosphotransfer) domain-containing protein